MNLILSQVGLTWTADAKGLRITTPKAAEQALVTIDYDLPAGNIARDGDRRPPEKHD